MSDATLSQILFSIASIACCLYSYLIQKHTRPLTTIFLVDSVYDDPPPYSALCTWYLSSSSHDVATYTTTTGITASLAVYKRPVSYSIYMESRSWSKEWGYWCWLDWLGNTGLVLAVCICPNGFYVAHTSGTTTLCFWELRRVSLRILYLFVDFLKRASQLAVQVWNISRSSAIYVCGWRIFVVSYARCIHSTIYLLSLYRIQLTIAHG